MQEKIFNVPLVDIPLGYGRFAVDHDKTMDVDTLVLINSNQFHEPGCNLDLSYEDKTQYKPVAAIAVYSPESAEAYASAFLSMAKMMRNKDN